MRYLLLLSLSLLPLYLTAKATSEPFDVSATEGLPSNLVNGVCIISGAYTVNHTDLVIAGPENFVVHRHYSSAAPGDETKGNGWYFNLNEMIEIDHFKDTKDDKPYWFANVLQHSGTHLCYRHSMREKDDEEPISINKHLSFDFDEPRGLTNGAHLISGRTNLKNQKLTYNGKKNQFKIVNGSGEVRLYKGEKDYLNYDLESITKPNGIFYDVHGSYILTIKCKSQNTKKTFSEIYFDGLEISENYSRRLVASDQRFIDYIYHMKTFKGDRHRELVDDHYIKGAVSPFFVEEHYHYGKSQNERLDHMVKRDKPEGRFQKIHYYRPNTNLGEGPLPHVHLTDEEDFRLDRVRSLESPVGTGPEAITTHYFLYKGNVKENKRKTKKVFDGRTYVYNALHHQTLYEYDEENRLTQITHYKGTSPYTPQSKETFIWDEREGHREGNLKGRTLEDAEGNIHQANFYVYDRHGNVTKSILCGALTGKPCHPVVLNSHQRPHDNAYEREIKDYTYTEDGLNLIETETDSQRIQTRYRYVPGMDLVNAKWLIDDTGIFAREFFHYTPEGILIRHVVDDGKGLEESDWTWMTERHVTQMSHTINIPYGLPECVQELYLDMNTGQEVLLHASHCHYSKHGQLIRKDIANAHGAIVYSLFWDYDNHGNLIREVNALGEETCRSYDANDNLITERFSNGDQVTHTYDFSNRLIRQEEQHVDGKQFVMTHRYNHLSQCIQTIDPYGNEKNFTYDEQGKIIATTHPVVPDEHGQVVSPTVLTAYNHAGQPIYVTDPKGRQTFSEFNIRNQPTKITYPDKTSEQYIYRIDGQLLEKIEKNGAHVYYLRDKRGHLLGEHIYSADGQLLKGENHTYNSLHLTSTTDAEGLVTHYKYDGAGRLEWTYKGEQKQQTLYDLLGRVSEIREWFGPGDDDYTSAIKNYDLLNRLIEERIQTAAGEVLYLEKTLYDRKGNKIFKQVGDQVTWTEYDGHGNPIKMTNALGQVTHAIYDTNFINHLGQRALQTRTTDPLGYQTIQTFDAANRLIQTERKNPYQLTVALQEISYDVCGNKVRVKDHVLEEGKTQRVIETYYHYDQGDRLMALVEASGTPEQKITHYAYNHYGQKTTLAKPDGQFLIYTYDALGRLQTLKSSDESIDYFYVYDRRDEVILVEDRKNHQMTARHYNAEGKLEAEELGNGLVMHYNYTRSGHLKQVHFPDQSRIDYVYNGVDLKEMHRVKNEQVAYSHYNVSYNLAGQVTKAKLAGEAGEIIYHYDALGRCLTIASNALTQEVPQEGYDAAGNLRTCITQGESYQFDYDDNYQLNNEQGHISHHYRLDSLGNRKAKNGENYSHNALNQIQQAGEESFSYDANGNIRERVRGEEKIVYTFDTLDRLTSVTKGNQTTHYSYDPFNRRLIAQGQTTKCFVYQFQEEVGVWANDCLEEVRFLGNDNRHPMVAMELKGELYLPIHDLFGNVASLMDGQGKVVERYRYTAYGEAEILNPQNEKMESSLVGNYWQYASKRWEDETGLVAFGLRYYDPKIGRWISPDPAGFEDGPNLYAYSHNNPFKYYDQFGLFSLLMGFTPLDTFPSPTECSYMPPVDTYQTVTPIQVERFMVTDRSYEEHANTMTDMNGAFTFPWCNKGSSFNNLNDMNLMNPITNASFNLPTVKGFYHCMSNGVQNDSITFANSMMNAGMLSGKNVDGIHAMSFSPSYDFAMYLLGRAYFAHDPVQMILDYWHKCFKECPTAQILHECHSRGAVDVRNALMLLEPELRQQIHVLAVAPGVFIDKHLCGSVVHLVSLGDAIPHLDQGGMARNIETVKFLRPIGKIFPGDHSFTNATYIEERRIVYKQFYKSLLK